MAYTNAGNLPRS